MASLGERMTKDVLTVAPEDTIGEVAQQMVERGVGSVVVADYGRLIGMLKAAVIAGDASAEARYVRAQMADAADSPPASYALALAALVEGDDGAAGAAAAGMRGSSPAMDRAADAITALVGSDHTAYDRVLRAIVADFEGRAEHLTGVPIADTALMLERLAHERGMACGAASPMLPAE